MKRFLILSCALGVGIILTGTLALAQSEESGGDAREFHLGTVLGIHYLVVPEEGAEKLEQIQTREGYAFIEGHVEGADQLLLKGDRGDRVGHYMTLWNIESKATRDAFWPEPGVPSAEMEEIGGLWEGQIGDRDDGLVAEADFAGDFILIGQAPWEEPPAFGLLGVHHMTMKAEIVGDFERFVEEKWHPQAHRGDVWVLVFKADRGRDEGKYILVYAFPSAEARDRYYPTAGGVTEEANRAWEPILDLWNEMMAFGGERMEWSDWVLVR